MMLEVRGLSDRSLETEVKTVLRDISFNVRQNEIVAFAGESERQRAVVDAELIDEICLENEQFVRRMGLDGSAEE